MSIELERITKTFGAFRALDDVSLTVPTGKLVALLGPSGSGKTTLLRIIAGLERPDNGSGAIRFFGEDVASRPVNERQVGFVFQHYALFRHMTVFENVAFGLRVQPRRARASRAALEERVDTLLRLVQLEGMAGRYPAQLSGGQRQRVALARALAVEPKLLLLDEPFGALDAKVRLELRRWLRRFHDEIHVTSAFVTHDQQEALEVADLVVVMNRGRVEQIGTPDEVYEHPATPFVFDFLGDANVLPAVARGGGILLPGAVQPLTPHPAPGDGPVDVYVRPSDLRVGEPDGPGVDVRIIEVQRTGPTVRAIAATRTGDLPLTVELPHLHHDVARVTVGAALRLRLMLFSVYPRTEAAGTPNPVLVAHAVDGV